MDRLDFNLHQLILSDLAKTVVDSPVGSVDSSLDSPINAISSRVETRVVNKPEKNELVEEPRVFMPTSRVRCNIAFGELALNVSGDYVDKTVAVLIDILRDVHFIDFEQTMSWTDWALPDQLVFSTISSLLSMAKSHSSHRAAIMTAITKFASQTVLRLESEKLAEVIVSVSPAFHGFYRAVISTPFPWTFEEWRILFDILNALSSPAIVDRLNRLLADYLESPEHDPELASFMQRLLSHYLTNGRPLSGYFAVCSIIEIQWTILAQALRPKHDDIKGAVGAAKILEAAAANQAWISLVKKPAQDPELSDPSITAALQSTVNSAMQCFTDLLSQIQDMEGEPPMETYAWETLSECLKLASLSCVALEHLDQALFNRIKLLLSEKSPLFENLVQESALQSATILVHNFSHVAPNLASHLRRFVTVPLSIFEFEFLAETRAPPPLAAAAACLALCIQLSPGDDFMMSYMYSLLNYVAATSKEISAGPNSGMIGTSPYMHSDDRSTTRSVETGLHGYSEDEKRLIGISTISVVTRLALEFDDEEVTRLTISMLLQRLRSAEPTVEAAIAYNLVDLALAATPQVFRDIIKAFSLVKRSGGYEGASFSNTMVLAAQTRLAQELHRRPDLYEIYLVELLSVFVDKGVAIQMKAASGNHIPAPDMIEELSALVLPIDALMSHDNFKPHQQTSSELFSLFRNMWFVCVLFRFTCDERPSTMNEWQAAALTRISIKTPPLVPEDAQDYVTSELEYNTALRKDYIHTAIGKHRTYLAGLISIRSSEIRHLSAGQVIFLLTMHDVETMRTSMGLPSSLASYFVNDGLNKSGGLSSCMDSVAEKVMRGCIAGMSRKIVDHSLDASISSELRCLLVFSCHRIAKVRDLASKYLNRLITAFPSLMCDSPVVTSVLEVLTLLQKACEGEVLDESTPRHEFRSDVANIVIELGDSYAVRKELLALLYKNAQSWFGLAIARAPMEVQVTLQKYLSEHRDMPLPETIELGASVASHYSMAAGPSERKAASMSGVWNPDRSKVFARQFSSKAYFSGEAAGVRLAHRGVQGMDQVQKLAPHQAPAAEIYALKGKIARVIEEIRNKQSALTVQDLRRLVFRCTAVLIAIPKCDYDLLHYVVSAPFEAFTPSAIATGIEAWTWLIRERPDMEMAIMVEIASSWIATIAHGKGMFSRHLNSTDPFYHPVEYSPTDHSLLERALASARRLLTPHTLLLQMLTSRYQAVRYRDPGLMLLLLRLILRSTRASDKLSTHPLAREVRFSLLIFGFEALHSSRVDVTSERRFRQGLYRAAFSWFAVRPQWSYGANRIQVETDLRLLHEFLDSIQNDTARADHLISSLSGVEPESRISDYASLHKSQHQLLRLLVENEITRLNVWLNPTNDPKRGTDFVGVEKTFYDDTWIQMTQAAWKIDPAVAVHMAERFKANVVQQEVTRLVKANAKEAMDIPEALKFLLEGKISGIKAQLKHVLLWSPVPPIDAVTYFRPHYENDPVVLQYAHRVLEEHPVSITFFFVPQIVQALRSDSLGYVARFIFETAKISQLFCHQIIWNMKANCFKDDLGEEPDPMKPALDQMMDMVVASLSGEARTFYDREFSFFREVTEISGKLKPYIKKTKPEKKAKIDEEMAKIKVQVGVYLPSNPDGKVIDIDRKSGRPLQSHAKAPFMATFKVRKERIEIALNPDSVIDGESGEIRSEYDVWQQAIFKVGDDCRQDVLALQVIALFKNAFNSVGLMLYLFPYRVTATAPGCGVIDVVPNATSRDEMGRSKVNDLLGFFVAKYGNPDTIAFQKARLNFVQSMAAYSVACYILQIKDRHNGNIMIDGEGHIVHIDFGFLFDIVKFEPNSFKLNHEMVVLMGGRGSQGYNLFVQLTVKAFMSIRPYANQIVDTVHLMLGTGLPSFKGEGTIKRLRERFALGLTERQAAEWMMGVIRNAHENARSILYDEFQRLQNGIPYA